MRSTARLVLSLASLFTFGTSCAFLRSAGPSLGAVVSQVDVGRLIECGKHLPDYGAAAKCLGAEAATQGLRIAFDKALELAEKARDASGPAGAADYTDDELEALAADLDSAMLELGAEIDATHG